MTLEQANLVYLRNLDPKLKKAIIQKRETALFDFLVSVALEGSRCPTGPQLEARFINHRQALAALANKGRIKISIYGRNWRVIEIVDGLYRGFRTKEPPFNSGPPYHVSYKGRHRYPRYVS